jgi:hypothetical protein
MSSQPVNPHRKSMRFGLLMLGRRLAGRLRRCWVLARFPRQATCEACGALWVRPRRDRQGSLLGFTVEHQACRRQHYAPWN